MKSWMRAGDRSSVEGRADGIFTENGITVIDEIKGMYTDVARLEARSKVHLAQAMCYGYFYCCDKDLDGIRLQLTYCNLETEEIRRFQTDRSKERAGTVVFGRGPMNILNGEISLPP